MNKGKYVFSQVVEFIDKYEFECYVKKYSGNYRIRQLNCWNQFLQLFFGQLTSLNSLQNICLCLKAHKNNLYHLGIKNYVNVSTLSRANENRNWMIFADFGDYLIKKVRPLYVNFPIAKIDFNDEIFILDSTTISCSINLLNWAEGKYSRGAVKMHTLLDLRGNIPEFIFITDGKYHDSNVLDVIVFVANAIYLMDKAYIDFAALYRINKMNAFFVSRAKSTLKYSVIEENFNIDQTTGLRTDMIIMLTTPKSKKLYPEKLRLVEFYDDKNQELLVFITNNFDVTPLELAYLYKYRWQIEVFFKWIKQNLTIKKLWGYSENAVKIHLWVAISTYLIVAHIKHSLKSNLSIYEIIQILGVSVFDKTPLKYLLTNINLNQNVNEQYCSNLFDNYFKINATVLNSNNEF